MAHIRDKVCGEYPAAIVGDGGGGRSHGSHGHPL